MHDTIIGISAWAVGLLLGSIYFGGLWLTARKGPASPRPGLWFGVSVARWAAVIAGFYYISRGHGIGLLACFIGFMTGRLAVTWVASRRGGKRSHDARWITDPSHGE